ncbi:MAG: hypothetical protein AAGJ93_16450, partial [Bacteroidota bacterium]
MSNYYYSLLFALVLFPLCLDAQTVIGEDFQLNDPDQQHILLTHNGDQLLGRVVYIEDDVIGFQIRYLDEVIQYSLAEISFVGNSENVQLQIAQQREIVAAEEKPYRRRRRNNGKTFPM